MEDAEPRDSLAKGRFAMMYGWDMTGWGWFWMILMWGGGALLLISLFLLALRGVTTGSKPPPEDPKAILARRFARGEIDEAEYRRRLGALDR